MRDYEEKSYYEIQLDNKQLILVFLSGLVLCILIFVLRVMVGKGQKEAEMAAMTTARPEGQTAKAEPEINTPEEPKQNQQMDEKTPPAPKTTAKPVAKAKEKSNSAAPKKEARTAPEQYSFYDLDKKDSSNSDLEQPVAKVAKSTKATTTTAEANSDKSTENTTKSGGIEYTVQVMATASKAKADERAASLRAKGYRPFVDQYKTRSGVVYKVRIGKFSDSTAARALASKLKQDMKLDTWVSPLE